jgi:hypothetical protein
MPKLSPRYLDASLSQLTENRQPDTSFKFCKLPQSIYLSMALQPFVGPWPLFQFLDLFTQTAGLLGRVISPLQGRYLHTE